MTFPPTVADDMTFPPAAALPEKTKQYIISATAGIPIPRPTPSPTARAVEDEVDEEDEVEEFPPQFPVQGTQAVRLVTPWL